MTGPKARPSRLDIVFMMYFLSSPQRVVSGKSSKFWTDPQLKQVLVFRCNQGSQNKYIELDNDGIFWGMYYEHEFENATPNVREQSYSILIFMVGPKTTSGDWWPVLDDGPPFEYIPEN